MVFAEIPFKARIELKDNVVTVRGSKALLDKVNLLKVNHGKDPRKWPKQSVATGEDILINEFILKANSEFKFCYNHEELCHCRNVPTEKVFTSIKNGCFKTEDVSRTTMAGTGCGACRQDIDQLIEQFNKP
ncbi:hypothetical protein CIK05_07675 [Bdellovibrio sp. qaytius]|nr:hypothetical protein CIK05_07675 [Bdellovibrio sp. qaytius]